MRFNIPYLLWVVKCCSKTFFLKLLLSQVHPKSKTDIWEVAADILQQYSFIHSFIPFWKELDSIMFSPFLCFLPVSVPVNKFAGKSFQREWPQRKHWGAVLESILSIFAMNIPTRCLIPSALFKQAQRGDTSEAVWAVKTKEQTLNMWHMQGARNRSLTPRNSHGAISAHPSYATLKWECHCWYLWKRSMSSGKRNKEAV